MTPTDSRRFINSPCLAVLIVSLLAGSAFGAKEAPPVPDRTQGGTLADKNLNDWSIGPSIPDEVGALALLATGDKQYLPLVADLAHKVGAKDFKIDESDRGMVACHWGYHNLFLTEYYLLTGDDHVLPAIRVFSNAIARGHRTVGTWGHGMAWPEDNNGQQHARIPTCLDTLETYAAGAKAELPQLRDLEQRSRNHMEKTTAKHAERVAEIIRKLEALPDDTRPLQTLDLQKEKSDR